MRPYPNVNSVLVLDNASVHDRDAIYALVGTIGAYVLFLPPYSYDFNPIELAFKVSKDYLLRHYDEFVAANPLGDKLRESLLNSVSSDMACNMFEHCFIEITPAVRYWATHGNGMI